MSKAFVTHAGILASHFRRGVPEVLVPHETREGLGLGIRGQPDQDYDLKPATVRNQSGQFTLGSNLGTYRPCKLQDSVMRKDLPC
jgi:hypothetical protein